MGRWEKQIGRKITEIRIRELNPVCAKIIGDIAKHYHESRGSLLVEKMIQDWPQLQQSIAQLQQRNTELHKAIAVYHAREREAKTIVSEMGEETKAMQRTLKDSETRLNKLLTQFAKQPAAKKKAVSKPSKKKK
jgi:septal ring factor EnvC (AmiA/AmiB activator)